MPRELLLQVSQLNLSAYSSTSLKRMGIRYLGDLVSLTESELLAGPRCGRKSARELKGTLSSLGLSLSMHVPAWGQADVAKLAERYAAELTRLRQAWLRRRYGIDSRSGVETEIASALAAVLKASDASMIESWIGLDQATQPTLRSVGDAAGVTRERIRQIVEKARRRLAAVQFHMPRLHSAVDLISRFPAPAEGQARSLLVSRGIAAAEISIHGLLRAAELFGVPVPSHVEQARMAARYRELAIAKKVVLVASRAVKKWGCSTIDDVCAQVNEAGDAAITADFVRETTTVQVGFHWLDEEVGWFWLERAPYREPFNRLVNRIDKILAVAHRVDLAVLRAGLARHFRMDGFAPPRRVLASFCAQLKDCRLVGGRTVVDTRPRDPAAELSRAERTMVEVFRKHGPILSGKDAFRRCGEAGLGKVTIRMVLSYSPIIQMVAESVFTLVGARVTPRSIEAKAKTTSRYMRFYQSAKDYGWRPDASGLWVTYRITDALLLRGTLRAPEAIKKHLDPRGYELRDLGGSRIGHVDISDAHISGFLPFFRRIGGDPGDHLRVTFDLAKRIALVELSEEAFDNQGSLK